MEEIERFEVPAVPLVFSVTPSPSVIVFSERPPSVPAVASRVPPFPVIAVLTSQNVLLPVFVRVLVPRLSVVPA